MFSKIKAIKEMRSQAKQMQNAMDSITSEGSGAWGKVKIKINGNQQILDLQIADALLSDKTKLQDALKEAWNDAHKRIQKDVALKMKEMGGLDMLKNMNL
jgi:DNA-binding YbaB/EbfC family protein